MKLSSVRLRLLLWNIGILLVALLGSQLLMHFIIRTSMQADMDRRLNNMSEGPMHFLSEADTDRPPPPPREPAKKGKKHRNHRPPEENRRMRMFRAFDLQGKNMMQRGTTTGTVETPWDTAAFARAATGLTVYSITRNSEDTLIRVLSRPVLRDGKRIGVLQVATSYEDMQALLKLLATMMFILIPCVLAVAGVGGLLLTDRALRPVRHIVQTAETLNPDDLSQRLPVVGTDEFAHLATTMNGMLSRIETAFHSLRQALERERRFTSDASHELRTPLTAIRANASLALTGKTTQSEYRESMQAINLAASMMQRLVEDLLLLARSDSGQLAPSYAEIDVQDLFAEAQALVSRDAPQATMVIGIDEDARTLRGDPHQLRRVLINLLENALRYTPAEGTITLSASRRHGQVILSVADTGEGIDAEHLPHLSERFYRLDASRARQHGGTGLGLAICKGIVEAHHGQLVIDSTPGQGTTVRVMLPADPA